MTEVVHVALIGDFDPDVMAHRAIPEALRLSARRLGVAISAEWVHTTAVGAAAETLGGYAAIWCVPSSPYASMEGALFPGASPGRQG
jgi:CTP synthase (UTP-ammonia lyase)